MYIGTPPQSGFISQEANQYFTGLTQNYIDLNQSISSLSSVIVLVNGVVQENSDLTLTSSTRITLGATLVSADKVTCIYVAKISSTQAPATGTVTLDMLSASGTKNSTTFLRGDNTFAVAGGDNTPAFSAYKDSVDQSLSGGGDVKVHYETEIFDSNGKYDTSNYRFTPTVAGKYFFMASAYVDTSGGVGTLTIAGLKIKKNGTTASKQRSNFDNNSIRTMTQQISCILDLDADDYVEVFAHAETTTGNGVVRRENIEGSNFIGFKLIT